MGKIVLSTLLLFLSGQIVAQNNGDKAIITGTIDKSTKASTGSETVVKLNVLAPLLGYSQFALEKSINDHRGIEFGLGIIGAGKNLNIEPRTLNIALDRLGGYHHRDGHKNQFGGFFEFGYKFKNPFNIGTRSRNKFDEPSSFEGLYIKPSFILGAYSFNQFKDDSTKATIRRHHSFGTILVNFGHQWVYKSRIVVDVYFGGGPEMDNVKEEDDLYGHPFVLAVAKDNPSVNVAVTAGFRIGYRF